MPITLLLLTYRLERTLDLFLVLILSYSPILYILIGPSKTDSIPIYSNSYKPRSLKFRLRANIEILYSVLVVLVVVVSIIGGSEKFLYRIVRS